MEYKGRLALMGALLALTVLFSLNLGRYPTSIIDLIKVFSDSADSTGDTGVRVLLDLRLPRVLMGVIAGMVFGSAAASLQSTFRNPLVSPYMLGVTQGAAFGAALAMYFDMPQPLILLLSLAFALGSLALALFLALVRQALSPATLVLAGVTVGALFSAALSILQYLVDPWKLQGIVFWLMGGFYRVSWESYAVAAPGALLGLTILLLMRWRLNLLSLSDEEARALGVRVGWERALVFSSAALAEASVTCAVGIVAFIGLIIPHLARPFFGSDNRVLIPASMLIGAVIIVLTDTLCRSLFSFEIPISIVTTLVTAPYFIYLLGRVEREWR